MRFELEGENRMSFPNEKELKKIRAKLSRVAPSHTLPRHASKADFVKYKLCEKFVKYILDHKISQAQLARHLHVDPSRINEIVKYRIDLFTVDKLMELAERLDLDFRVDVA